MAGSADTRNDVTEQLRHDEARGRFQLTVDGYQARLDYRREPGRMVITHTGVPPQIGGRGIAAQLVEAALSWARGQQLKVATTCSYANAYLRRHPQHRDLLA